MDIDGTRFMLDAQELDLAAYADFLAKFRRLYVETGRPGSGALSIVLRSLALNEQQKTPLGTVKRIG